MLTEWHLTPEYINDHWTDEELAVMVQARGDRLRRSQQPVNDEDYPSTPSRKLISDDDLFKSMGVVVKKR